MPCAVKIFMSVTLRVLFQNNARKEFYRCFSDEMALKESEIRVLAILGLIILILWAFFGLFWSLLLVFTFLIYAYNFGRQQNASSRPGGALEDEPDVTLYQEQLPNDPPEFQDLPFTCLRKGQFTLRSPMPLLSDVTKRLSFNTSTITPHFQAKKTWNDSRQLSSPYMSRGNSVAYWRKSNHFSLLNPELQRPSTVKIASPDVTLNRTFTLSHSPLKRTTPDHTNPCSRDSVLSALRESRKRSFAADDDEDPELFLRPTKRRGTKPGNSLNAYSTHDVVQPINRPMFSGLKRAALRDSKETSVEENVEKKSKFMEHRILPGYGEGQRREDSTQAAQKRKNVFTKSSHHRNSTEATEGRKSKKTKNSTAVEEQEDQRPTTVERNNSCMAVDLAVHNVFVDELNQDADSGMSDSELKERTTKNSSSSEVEDDDSALTESQQTNTKVKSGDQDNKDHTTQCPANKDTGALRGRKRFTIPRFLSKEDSRRRTVPVYCASNEESELPQRRTVARKINQEQMKIDRKLAWERVKKFLDDDDDDDDDEAEEGKPLESAVSSATTSSGSSSLFKIPTGLPVKIPGTAATTTTQSLVLPALSTGKPQQTTGGQGSMATSVPQANGTEQGNTALAQSQVSMRPLSQSQQTLGSRLFTKLSSIQGTSTSVSTLSTAIAKQVNLVNMTCASRVASLSNPSTTVFQVNSTLTSAVASAGTTGFQFGNSPFSKPVQTNQLNSLTDPTHKTLQSGFQFGAQFGQSPLGSTVAATQNSAQKVGFCSPLATSSSVIGTSSTTAASLPGGFNFAIPGLTQLGFSLNKVVSQSTPAAGQVNNPSTLSLATSTSQTSTSQTSQNSHSTVAFGVNTTTVTQSPFTSLSKPTQSTLSTVSSTGIFGQNTNTSQSSFGLMTQNKGGFGSTNMQSISRSTQPVQGALEGNSSDTFGALLGKKSAPNPFNQSSLGSQSNQKVSVATFGSITTQTVFGAPQSQPASQNIFGVKNALNTDAVKSPFTFGSQVAQSTDKNASGNQPSPFTFRSQPNQNAPQSVFGSQPTQNAFGTPLNQSSTQSPFETHATQNVFGAQLNQPTTQSAFGAPTCTKQASKSSFSFAVNTAQNSSSSPFGGFGNESTVPSQNTAAPSGGFNFTAPASNSTTGGFNFNTAANKTGGFQFGSSTAPQTASPLTVPNTPSTGFNFAPGSSGMAGSPFASSSPAPPFGAPSTPQGPNNMSTARTRARVAARRRGKK